MKTEELLEILIGESGSKPEPPRRRGSYKDGYKYCSGCALWFKTKEVRCPHCGRLLRYSNRTRRGQSVDPNKYLNGAESLAVK